MSKQYCIYLRKSRADDEAELRGEGDTLLRHEKTLLALAKRRHLNVTEIYREVVSGETISARPQMQRLLRDVERGKWDGVIVMEVERLARGDTSDQGIVAKTFKYSGTLIITIEKTYDPNNEFDEEYFEFGLFMSRREYKTIRRRLEQGRLSSVKEGKYCGSRPPYGYEKKKLEHEKGYTLEPIPEQAKIVNMIFDWYTKGILQEDGTYKRIGVGIITRKLNELKIPPQRGNDWSISTIRGIVSNPVYIGKICWNRRPEVKKMVDGDLTKERPRAENYIMVDGLHEPIINDDTFKLAQEYLANNRARPIGEKNTVKNPLAGIVVCGKCGRRMVRRPYAAKLNQPDTLMCAATSCDNVSCALHYVEDRILKSLEDWLNDYKAQWQNYKEPDNTEINIKKNSLKKIDSELTSLNKQLDNIHNLLEQGIYSTETFLERNRILSQRIQQASDDKNELENELRTEKLRRENQVNIIPKVEKLLDVYHDLETPKEKNDMLKEVIEKVVYVKDKNGRWHYNPDDFQIILYPKLPKDNIL